MHRCYVTSFVHLHNHTGYSLVDGLNRVAPMVEAAHADGAIAVATTDHGNVGAWFALHEATAKLAKKDPNAPFAIYGEEMYLAVGSRFDRDTVTVEAPPEDDVAADGDDESADGDSKAADKVNYHLTVLAASEAGYRNLIALNNLAHDEFWHKPRIDLALLKEFSEGLIVLTGCLGGPVTSHLAHGEHEKADENLALLIQAVGAENVYVELMEHGVDEESAIQADLVALAVKHGLRWVVTNDCHFTHEDDALAHEAWLAVGSKKGGKAVTLEDPDRWRFPGSGYWIRTADEMFALRDEPWWAEGCAESVRIAERIGRDVMPEYGMRLPRFPLPDGYTESATYLRDMVRAGAFNKYGEDPAQPGKLPPDVNDRLLYEFSVINGAGMSDYFLIVAEMIQWARDNGILVGPGRGSGAGSCIAYCLGIVLVEPISNGLLFERFLNPERVGMPDFDVDFDMRYRGKVIRHLIEMYGEGSVARIGTRGIVRTRQAIKDAGRVMGVPIRITDQLAALVPIDEAKPRSLTKLLAPDAKDDPSAAAFLSALASTGEVGEQLMWFARRFESVQRSESIHACGVVVSNEPLLDLMPMRRDRKGETSATDGEHVTKVTTWEGGEVEKAGFLKMDVLAIRTLSVVALTAEYVEATTGAHIDVYSIDPARPDDEVRDRKAWELVAEGRTEGVFQLESAQMTDLAMDVKPSCLEDITALVALYRPGPMAAGAHTRYAARKNGREPVTYDHITVDPAERSVISSILDRTLAVPVYQEQLMQLGGAVGGLDAATRNKLQKAFSKKLEDLMKEVKESMFAGGLAGSGPEGVVFSQGTLDRLWSVFEGSASYLFNKSHAAAYGHLSYVTAYLKANWPVEYAAALLAMTDKDDKRASILRSLVSEGITVNAPDINRSMAVTMPNDGAVWLGLSEIKGVGKIADDIVAERDDRGPFLSMGDLLRRVQRPNQRGADASITVSAVEALIEAGALDAFGTRKGMVRALRAAKHTHHIESSAEWGAFERSQRQRFRTGVTLGEHPLRAHGTAVLHAIHGTRFATSTLVKVADIGPQHDKQTVVVPGIITSWREKSYSRGRMANVTLEGGGGEQVEMVVWDAELAILKASDTPIRLGHPVLVQAKVESKVYTHEIIGEDGESEEQTVTRTTMSARAVLPLMVDDGGVSEDWSDEMPPFGPLRRSESGASVVVRALPRRGPAPSAATHLVPLASLVNTGGAAWVKPSDRTAAPLVYVVTAADASLDDTRTSMDGPVDLTAPDAAGWSEVAPAALDAI